MAKILYNKNVAKPSEVTYDVFSSDDIKYGEIVLCNSIDEPGIYIFTKGEHGETGIKKINDVESVVIKENIDPSLSGPVTSGDSLMEVISKLQNQINESVASAETATTKTNNIVIGVGLNADGTYKAIAGDYVAEAEDIADAIAKLDAAITSVSGNTLAEAKAYADSKISEALDSLDTVEETENGEVFVKISEINGIISTEKKELSVAKDETGLQYDLKLGDYIFGTINIPQDQFLSGVTFIESATVQDVADALNHGQIIEEGKPYLKFIWVLDSGVTSPTYVDVSSLIDIYDATQIQLSGAYTGTSFDIKSGTTLQDAVDKITTELVTLINTVIVNKIETEEKTIIVTPTVSGTNIDVHIDNETIVKNDSVSKQGELSVKLNIDKQNFDSGNVKAKYTIKSKTGEYGVITDTRDIMVGPNQFLTVETEPVVDESGNRTDKTTIQPVLVSGDWNDINGYSVQNGNGLATAYEVKQYVKDGIDGDNIFVGNNHVGYIYGRIDFNQSGITYDNVHEAFVRTDNNMVRLDNTIGLDSDGVNVHLYPSGKTQNCLLIKDNRTIIDALVTLDTAIDDMDYTANTGDNKVITGITQTNGHVKVTSENLTSRKLAGYAVQTITDTSAAASKVATGDTLGVGLGKLQGQINAMDYTANTGTDKVFTYVANKDGQLTTSAENITSRVITGYAEATDADIVATDTLGVALGKLQKQINSMDKTASAATGKFVRTVAEDDGKVSETLGYILDSDVKIATATTAEVTDLGTNVKEAYKLVNNQGTRLGDFVKIYKDSSLNSVTLSGDSSTTGQWMIFNYTYSDGSTGNTAVDISKFLVQAEFKSGVTSNNAGIVHGVVDSNSEKNESNVSFLTVGADGFKVSGIKDAIDTNINKLDSSTADVSAGYVLTKVAIADGKISGRTQTDSIHSATTASHAVAAGKVDSALTVSYGSTASTTVTYDGSVAKTINIPNNTNQLTNGANFITTAATVANANALSGTAITGLFTAFSSPGTGTTSAPETSITVGGTEKKVKINADLIDGKHVSVVSAIPPSPDANTIYILA